MQEGPAHNRVADAFDKISIVSGRITSWLTFFMVVVTVIVVVMRYVFDAGAVWLQESVVWMHAVVFMVGAAYTLQQDEHVRVDIFYRGLGERRRAWVDLLGTLLFLLPFCVFALVVSWPSVRDSWGVREVSPDPGGLARWPIKAAVMLAFGLLLLQGLSETFKRGALLLGAPADELGIAEPPLPGTLGHDAHSGKGPHV